MRRFIMLALVAICFNVAVPAHAAEITLNGFVIKGAILRTWMAAGGEDFGIPIENETRIRMADRSSYHQDFVDASGLVGKVFYSSLGKQAKKTPSILSVSGVRNERDALARTGFAPWKVLRSGKLCESTTYGKQALAAMLHDGGLIIDFRTSGAASGCPDPKLFGVSRVRLSVTADANYPKYVTEASRRAVWKAALIYIANNPGPVLVHCTAGKDRTGWFVTILLKLLGATDEQAKQEFLRTSEAPLYKWQDGMEQVVASYGSWEGYIDAILGDVSDETKQKLLDKLS